MQDHVEYIWSDLHQELKKFILVKVKDPAMAEDLLQEVFIKVHLHLHQLKDPARLTSWVYQISRNVMADHFKQSKNIPVAGLPLWAESETEDHIYSSLSNCINGKIAKLPTKDREAVLLTYFQHYSQKELADFLGISYSGAKNRIQRARQKLRQEILDCENVSSDTSGKITGLGENIP